MAGQGCAGSAGTGGIVFAHTHFAANGPWGRMSEWMMGNGKDREVARVAVSLLISRIGLVLYYGSNPRCPFEALSYWIYHRRRGNNTKFGIGFNIEENLNGKYTLVDSSISSFIG